MLARSPQEIKIGQIFEAAIGPVNIVECVAHPDQCLRAVFCECRVVYSLINQKINRVLNETFPGRSFRSGNDETNFPGTGGVGKSAECLTGIPGLEKNPQGKNPI